jgi:hypothetical protein
VSARLEPMNPVQSGVILAEICRFSHSSRISTDCSPPFPSQNTQ